MVAAILEPQRHAARPQPRRREHGRRRRRGAGRARAARRRHGPVRGRRVLARPGGRRAAAARACCSPTCSATSSTATASSRRSPTAGRRSSPASPPRPRSCSTPTTRSSPTSAATATPLYFGVEDDALALPELQHASDSKHCRRCGARLRLRRGLPRPPRPLPLPELRRAPPRAGGHARPTSSCAASARRAFTLRTPDGDAAVELPLPGLYNVYNALGAAALVPARSACRSTTSSPGWPRSRPRSAAPRRSSSAAATVDPARQEPGRRQRGAAHARARGRASTTCSACSTTAPPTAATSRGCGTPTSSSSRRTCAG